MALGAYSPIIAKSIGETVSVYPVKGYSATLPIDGANNPPTVGGIDEDNLFAYVRMGDSVRLTAVAEFAGYDTSHRPSDFATMLGAAKDLLPNAGDYERPSYWACLRPMTPEGTPILGKGRHENLYYNTGHGHMGWTMACGTARITSDLIAGRRPDLPHGRPHPPLGPSRASSTFRIELTGGAGPVGAQEGELMHVVMPAPCKRGLAGNAFMGEAELLRDAGGSAVFDIAADLEAVHLLRCEEIVDDQSDRLRHEALAPMGAIEQPVADFERVRNRGPAGRSK